MDPDPWSVTVVGKAHGRLMSGTDAPVCHVTSGGLLECLPAKQPECDHVIGICRLGMVFEACDLKILDYVKWHHVQ